MKWGEQKILTVSILKRMTHKYTKSKSSAFLRWYYFKELPSSCMNTHLHTHVDQRTLATVGNFCNICLPQNLLLRWCHNSLPGKLLRYHIFPTGKIKGNHVPLNPQKNWDFSIYPFTQTASIPSKNRKPNIPDKLKLSCAPASHLLLSEIRETAPSDFTHVKWCRLCVRSKGASADACFAHPLSV